MFFLDIAQARETKTKINKLKSFCAIKETINKKKRHSIKREKIFNDDTSGKGLISKIL